MKKLPLIVFGSGIKEIEILGDEGQTLRESMLNANIHVASGCNGNGQCGQCKVIVIKGIVSKLTRLEKQVLSSSEIQSHIRLACQCLPLEKVVLQQVVPALDMSWNIIEVDNTTASFQAPENNQL